MRMNYSFSPANEWVHLNYNQRFFLLPHYGLLRLECGHQQATLMSLMRRHIKVKAPMIARFERKSAPPFYETVI